MDSFHLNCGFGERRTFHLSDSASLERILRKTCKGKEEVQEDKEGKPWCLLFALEHLKVEVVESVGPSDMMEPSCVVRA